MRPFTTRPCVDFIRRVKVPKRMRRSAFCNRGFSVLELLLTIAIAATLAGVSILIANQVFPTLRSDSAIQLLQSQLLQTRENAMDQRRNFTVTFIAPNEFQIVRQELGGSTTQIADYFLPNGATYQVLAGVPDTPDGLGNAQPITFAQNKIKFVSDGTVQDGNGNLNNGTIFIAIGSNPMTARTVTVMGATARIRAYRYDGGKWN